MKSDKQANCIILNFLCGKGRYAEANIKENILCVSRLGPVNERPAQNLFKNLNYMYKLISNQNLYYKLL